MIPVDSTDNYNDDDDVEGYSHFYARTSTNIIFVFVYNRNTIFLYKQFSIFLLIELTEIVWKPFNGEFGVVHLVSELYMHGFLLTEAQKIKQMLISYTVWNCLKFKRVTSAYWIPRLFTLQNSSLNLSEYIGFYDSKTHHLSIFEVETGTRSVNFHAIFNRNNNYHSNSETMKLHFFQIKCLQRCGSYFFFFLISLM